MICRKYWKQQPKFWARFLRENYPVARITDFFSIPYDDIKSEFYEYERIMEDADADPNETGTVFDPLPHIQKLKSIIATLGDKMDMNKAIKWTQSDTEAAELGRYGAA